MDTYAGVYGFTATRQVRACDLDLIRDVILTLPSKILVVTGGCIGGDAVIARMARKRGLDVHTILPANRAQVDPDWAQHCTSFQEMPPGTDYRDRNQAIVRMSDTIIGFPQFSETDPRSRRSGTWMTLRLARRAEKSVEIWYLGNEDEHADPTGPGT